MVVNFRARGISRGARKAGPNTHVKLKKQKRKKEVKFTKYLQNFHCGILEPPVICVED
jgi:hypothetical protein